MGCPLSPRTPPLSPEGAQGPWAEEVLDSNFLGSGEELDLLSEILDTLSVQTKSMGSLRPSQSLDCCHGGDLDSCLSLVRTPTAPHHPILPQCPSNLPALSHLKVSNLLSLHPRPTQPDIPGRERWQPDEEKLPEPQPLSLPADLSSLQNTQSLEITCSSENPNSQLPSGANQEIISPSQFSAASTDASSRGDTESSPLTEPSTLHLFPLQKAAEHSRPQESPCTRLSTANAQPSPPKTPQLLAPVELDFDIVSTSLDSSRDPSFPENPRTQPPKILLEHARFQSPEESGALNTHSSPTSDWQEPHARRQPRVADLKKCFEG